jgi:PAS domain S-box-containing protein
MPWIDKQTNSLIKHWLRSTSAPMLASTESGEILWCNTALEKLLGYTEPELTRAVDPVTWTDITGSRSDLSVDQALVSEVIIGTRQSYQLQKQYRHKSGQLVDVIIHVMRWPAIDEMECFLVTVYPVGIAAEQMVQQLISLETTLGEIVKLISQPQASDFDRMTNWIEKHPHVSKGIALFLAFLLFGDRVVEFAQMFMPTMPVE